MEGDYAEGLRLRITPSQNHKSLVSVYGKLVFPGVSSVFPEFVAHLKLDGALVGGIRLL